MTVRNEQLEEFDLPACAGQPVMELAQHQAMRWGSNRCSMAHPAVSRRGALAVVGFRKR